MASSCLRFNHGANNRREERERIKCKVARCACDGATEKTSELSQSTSQQPTAHTKSTVQFKSINGFGKYYYNNDNTF